MKSRLILISNIVLCLAASLLVATGFVLEFKIGENSTATRLGFGREEWGEFHFFTALSVVAATIRHLIANLWWLRQAYARWPRYTILLMLPGALPAMVFLVL
jgi:hypothetical protein